MNDEPYKIILPLCPQLGEISAAEIQQKHGLNSSFPHISLMPANLSACVASLLRQRLDILEIDRGRYRAGVQVLQGVINSYRLLFIRSGRMRYELPGWECNLRAGDLLLVPAWMKRGWRSGPGLELLWTAFNPEAETVFPKFPFHTVSGNPRREGLIFKQLLRTWNAPVQHPTTKLFLEGEIKALLGHLVEHTPTDQPLPAPPVVGSALLHEIASLAAWMEQHYADPDLLTHAAQRITTSDHYFREKFHAHTGFTLGQYCLMLRMRRARHLLTNTALTVKEIATRVGLRDALYFSRCYRKFWGHPPKSDRQ